MWDTSFYVMTAAGADHNGNFATLPILHLSVLCRVDLTLTAIKSGRMIVSSKQFQYLTLQPRGVHLCLNQAWGALFI